MNLLNQSAFLQALGWAIANSLWQMAALWLCYQLSLAISRKATASAKNLLATILLFTGSGWFLFGLFTKYNTLQNDVVVVLQADKLQNQQAFHDLTANTNTIASFIDSAINFIEQYLPYLSSAYLMVLLLLFARLIYAWYQSRMLKRQGLIAAAPEWITHFGNLVEQSGIQKKISLWLSEKIDVPATLGFVKPVILLPVAVLNNLTPSQVETILLHELAHIKRNDYLINLLVAVAETMLFFNPFAALLSASLKKERENSCDDFVLQFHNQPETYARALLVIEQNRKQIQPLILKATGDGQLLQRVKRIMNVPVNNFNYGQRLIAFLLTAGILSSLAWMKPASQQTQTAKQAFEKNDIASRQGANKIILTPAMIEKRPGGEMMLFDDKKKNSLLVKVNGNKVKLLDATNNIEINADELELDRMPFPDEEALKTFSMEQEKALAEHAKMLALQSKEMVAKELNNQRYFFPGNMLKTKIPFVDLGKELTRKKRDFSAAKEMKSHQMAEMMKEWENLPTKEDWQKMKEEINNELVKLDIQLKLQDMDAQKLDSVIKMASLFSDKRLAAFDAVKLKHEQEIKGVIQLKQLADNLDFMIINNEEAAAADNSTEDLLPEETAQGSKQLMRKSFPRIRIYPSPPGAKPANKHPKKTKVIISL